MAIGSSCACNRLPAKAACIGSSDAASAAKAGSAFIAESPNPSSAMPKAASSGFSRPVAVLNADAPLDSVTRTGRAAAAIRRSLANGPSSIDPRPALVLKSSLNSHAAVFAETQKIRVPPSPALMRVGCSRTTPWAPSMARTSAWRSHRSSPESLATSMMTSSTSASSSSISSMIAHSVVVTPSEEALRSAMNGRRAARYLNAAPLSADLDASLAAANWRPRRCSHSRGRCSIGGYGVDGCASHRSGSR